MTLLGVIFIPMLFLSSAFFLAQLAKARQNVDVSVNAARFSNQLMEELYRTQRVLPDSNDTEIHFSYYDGIRQEAVIRGYRLTTSGSYQILEKLVYDTATDTWTALSPYGTVQADQVLLPTTSVFAYCDSASCGANPEQALFVQLSGWEFMPAKNTNRKVDFPDMDVYLSAGASSADMMLANAPQELYSFASSTSFGNGANLNKVFLAPTGRTLNIPDTAIVTGGLSTIYTGSDKCPGRHSMKMGQDGRVFFGTENSSCANSTNSEFLTWHDTTGLSTLVTGVSAPGRDNNATRPNGSGIATAPDGRVYFGEEVGTPAKVWTWHASTGLSTIGTNFDGPFGENDVLVTADNGRIVIGEYHAYGATGKNLTTYHPSTGLSTLLSVTETAPGVGSANIHSDGAIYFGEYTSSGSFWRWKDGVLSTILNSENQPGRYSTRISPADGRVYFGESTTGASYWTYHTSTGLSTIIASAGNKPGRDSSMVASDGRIFFGIQENPGKFWTWKTTTGLSTIMGGGNWTGVMNGALSANGRVFFGEQSSSGDYWSWHESTGLSTVVSAVRLPGFEARVATNDGRIYLSEDGDLGDSASDVLWTWKDNVLSTIIPASAGLSRIGATMGMAVNADGRLFVGRYVSTANGQMWTWHPNTGLSTLLTNTAGLSLYYSVHAYDVANGYGAFSASDNVWVWQPGYTNTSAINRVSTMGIKTNQALTMAATSDILAAATQDANGEIYFVNTSNTTVDRYTYSGGTFGYTTQFGWGTSTGAVGAVAVDQYKSGIALLDTANKQIDYYSNRKTTGSPTAANQYALTATTTPTGLAVSGRTGNYLVLDSAQQGSNPNKYVRLFVYNDTGTQITNSPWKIYIGNTAAQYPLSVDATGETAFKIQYDDEKNILYLIAPTVGRVYALMLPEPL